MAILIPLDRIDDSPYQTRTVYDQEKIVSLATSIKQNGLIQAPVARLVDGKGQPADTTGLHLSNQISISGALDDHPGYRVQLAVGHSRLRACRYLGYDHMHISLRILTDEQMDMLAWSENHDRGDLTPIEEARAIADRIERHGWTQAEAAGRLNLARSTVSNKLRLLKLPPEVLYYVQNGSLSERQAVALVPAFDLSEGEAEILEGHRSYLASFSPEHVLDLLGKDILQGWSSDEIRESVGGFRERLEKLQEAREQPGPLSVKPASTDSADGITDEEASDAILTKDGQPPNAHGVYTEPTEVLQMPTTKKGPQAEIKLVELKDGSWLYSSSVQFTAGTHGAYSGPITLRHRRPSREEAVSAAAGSIHRFCTGRSITHDEQKRQASQIIAWLGTLGVPIPADEEPEEPATDDLQPVPYALQGGTCRVCGCTDDDCSQCIEKTGEPCHWVEPGLCSACAEEDLDPDSGPMDAGRFIPDDDVRPRFIAWDDRNKIIWGLGATEEEARADAVNWIDEGRWEEYRTPGEALRSAPAAAELIAEVEAKGGDGLAWHLGADGVAGLGMAEHSGDGALPDVPESSYDEASLPLPGCEPWAFQDEIATWAEETFPESTWESALAHLDEEIYELGNASTPAQRAEELADCLLILCHLAHKESIDLLGEARRKLEICKNRQWGEPDSRGVVRHVEFFPGIDPTDNQAVIKLLQEFKRTLNAWVGWQDTPDTASRMTLKEGEVYLSALRGHQMNLSRWLAWGPPMKPHEFAAIELLRGDLQKLGRNLQMYCGSGEEAPA